MNKHCLSLLALFALGLSAHAASVSVSDGGKTWEKLQAKTIKPARRADDVNAFGGSVRHKLKATGYFYVTKIKKQWWLVDPDGHLFIMKGLNSVEAERVGRYDSEQWAKDTYELMRQNGFNTLGRWSEQDAFKEAGVPMPWCSTTSFMKDYDKRRPAANGESGFPNETLPVFDPEWPEFCEEYAGKHVADLKDDKWLIGHFSDNELPFVTRNNPNALAKYLALPRDDAGYKGAWAWMRENKYRESNVDDEDVQLEFLEHVARLYYENVAKALRKADPNHLYIGSRLHGSSINPATIAAAGACDIISVNYYHRWEPEEDRMEEWEELSNSPFFVSEFYAMKVTRDDISKDEGAGFRVKNYEDAAAFYHTHTVPLLEDVPSCVGWHWFKYADDNPEFSKGVISNKGEVHQTLLDGMKIVNDQAYSLRGLR